VGWSREIAASIEFQPLAESDLDTVSKWLAAPHVRRWWRDPADPPAVRAKYLPRIRGDEPTQVFVASSAARAFGLIQRYRFSDYGTWAATVAGSGVTFPNAAGIDYMIGLSDRVGRGVGTAMIAKFTDLVFKDYDDVQTIVVTPQRANRASCRALEHAGYSLVAVGRLDSEDPADEGDAAIYARHRPNSSE
jgi:aminoglycoside 6'-N-acetyltransferase